MYKIVTVRDKVRVDPKYFLGDVKEAVLNSLKSELEGKLVRGLGIVLKICSVKEVGVGEILPEDGGIYYDAVYDMLVYVPELHEVVEGEVLAVKEFGAIVEIGPLDGLIHISQIMDDYVTYSKAGVLQGRSTKKTLKVGDIVRARIVAISLKSLETAKVALTMRQPGLGKLEWLEEERKKEAKKK